MSNFFARKIAKNVETGSILANFSFFVKFFARKMRKMSNSRGKLTKNFKTGVILAHFDFFSQKIPDDSVVRISVVRARLSPNRSGSGDPNLQGGAVGNVNDENVPLFCSLRSPDRKQG